jgi:3-hydroxybutyryl-CoA dehydrogenase
LVDGIADHETIDRTWRIATGAPAGPFQIYDVVGLTTAYNIASEGSNPQSQRFAALLKENYLDKGKLGTSTGEGFYTY